jgi:predicted SAM-dependent methyltransferase
MKFLEIAGNFVRGPEWECINFQEKPGCIIWDMTNLPLPYTEESFDGIYSNHFIEHMYKYQGERFLQECHRLLKPNGRLRTCWPSYEMVIQVLKNNSKLRGFIDAYYQFYIVREKFAPEGNEHKPKHEQVALGLLHQKGEHKYIWGATELAHALQEAGFSSVHSYPYGVSDFAGFNGIETPNKIREAHSYILEAVK